MKSVYELIQPVADSKGFIYEKAAIMEYIAKNGRGGAAVNCPVSGEFCLCARQVQSAWYPSQCMNACIAKLCPCPFRHQPHHCPA